MNVLLKPAMRLLHARIRASLNFVPHPVDAPQAHGSGPDPDRVLVFGSGAAIGMGVVSHQLALPGRLAEELSRLTGRGADVDIAARRRRDVASAVSSIKRQELSRYDGIVVTLGAKDAFALTSPERWSASIQALLIAICEDSPASTPIVLTGIHPVRSPHGVTSPLTGIANIHAQKLNYLAEQICARNTRASFVPLPPPAKTPAGHYRTSEAYTQWARLIAGHLAPRLPVDQSKVSGEVTARQIRAQPQSATKRQRALSDLSALNDGPEARFERIVALARAYFHTDFAAFVLSDGDREWFKAKVGFRGTPDLAAMTTATIDAGGPLIVGNARADERFRVSGPAGDAGIGFYVGYPVEAPDGTRIGVLSAFDRAPREAKTVDRIMLRDLAMMLQRELWTSEERNPAYV